MCVLLKFNILTDINLYVTMFHTSEKDGSHQIFGWFPRLSHLMITYFLEATLSEAHWLVQPVGLVEIRADALSNCWLLSIFSMLCCYNSAYPEIISILHMVMI